MSYVIDDSTMVNLHGEGGVELVERKEGEGWVNEIEGPVFVRRAKKGEKSLEMTLVAAGEGEESVKIRIGGLNNELDVVVTLNGEVVNFHVEGDEIVIENLVADGVDAIVIVTWE
ncbi:hypothetical protein TrLO_g5220 [Triparma laevis f. longispina]|uniref:Uncharacterized protein n=1 Tax=Triparma laevis f. longispina TaxID=1714387 RepID=A0A9W7A3G5_9STRA|nr:hypothetical protein TrLO_g5220 [Triparma laevis f. longispina]